MHIAPPDNADIGGSRGSRPADRFVVLDSIRGVCACIVMMLHLAIPGYARRLAFFSHGFVFVDFFFVLSGFVIASSYAGRLGQGFGLGRFMALRLGRVYPLHVVVLLLYVAAVAAAAARHTPFGGFMPFEGGLGFGPLLATFGLVQIFGIGSAWNPPSWSIASEMWTYLLFGAIFCLRGRAATVACAAVTALAAIFLALRFGYLPAIGIGSWPRCVVGFGVGVFTYRLLAAGRVPRMSAPLASLVEIALCVAIVLAVARFDMHLVSFGMLLLFAAAILAFAQEGGVVSRLLSMRVFVLLGTLSYSIYMTHFLIGKLFVNILHKLASPARILSNLWIGDLAVLAMLGIVVAVSLLTYHFVERPMQRWSRTLVGSAARRATTRQVEHEAPTF